MQYGNNKICFKKQNNSFEIEEKESLKSCSQKEVLSIKLSQLNESKLNTSLNTKDLKIEEKLKRNSTKCGTHNSLFSKKKEHISPSLKSKSVETKKPKRNSILQKVLEHRKSILSVSNMLDKPLIDSSVFENLRNNFNPDKFLKNNKNYIPKHVTQSCSSSVSSVDDRNLFQYYSYSSLSPNAKCQQPTNFSQNYASNIMPPLYLSPMKRPLLVRKSMPNVSHIYEFLTSNSSINDNMNSSPKYNQSSQFNNIKMFTPISTQSRRQSHQIPLLELKPNKRKKKEIKGKFNINVLKDIEICENIFKISSDQNNCRFVQQKIEMNPNFAKQLLIPFLLQSELFDLVNLFCSNFGNYLVQKLLQVAEEMQIIEILQKISEKFDFICGNNFGTRVIQNLMDNLSEDSETFFINIISQYVYNLSCDQQGTHVIQKCIFNFTSENMYLIYEVIIQNTVGFSRNKHGCCVIQKCILNCPFNIKSKIIQIILGYCHELIKDQYANYVIQSIIELRDDYLNHLIAECFCSDLCKIGVEKFASNVIEKCFKNCSQETKDLIIKSVAKKIVVKTLLFSPFGNYVLQNIVAASSGKEFMFFLNEISELYKDLKSNPIGQKVAGKLIMNIPKLKSILKEKKLI